MPLFVLLGIVSLPGMAQVASGTVATLPPVVTTATRFPEDPALLPFGVSVLTASDIRDAGVGTVNEALMKLLGVPGRQDFYGGGDYALDARGFGSTADSNQVVVIDGIRVSEGDLGGTRLAGIAIDSVERIELIRGSGTVLYGEGATGGVIVITTKAGRGAERKTQAQLFAAVGSHGLREGRATGTVVAGGFSVDVSGNQRRSDNHRDNFRSEVDGASATAQWGNEWLRLGVRHAQDELASGLPGSLTTAQYLSDPRQSTSPNDRAAIRNTRDSVFMQAWVGDWQLAFDAGWREKALQSDSGGFAYAYDIDATTQALRAKHEARFGPVTHALTVGWDEAKWTRTVAGAFGSVSRQDSRGLYAHNDLTLAAGTRLSAGVRTERSDKRSTSTTDRIDHRQTAWELGLTQPVAPGVAVFGRVARSFRLANADEFSFTSPGVAMRPQTSRDTEIGARWHHAAGRVELRLYRNDLRDEIGYDRTAPGPFGPGANINFDPTRRSGVELEAKQALSPSVSLSLNAAHRRSEFVEGPHAGRRIQLTPRHSLALRGEWRPSPSHQLAAVVNRVSSQYPDAANTCLIPSHTTLDLRYAYQFRQAQFALGLANLTDRDHYTQAFGCAGGVPTSIYPEAGRTLSASVRLQF